MVGDVAKRFALQGRNERRGHCSVEHHLGRAKALVHVATCVERVRCRLASGKMRFPVMVMQNRGVSLGHDNQSKGNKPTTRELHRQPVGLNLVRFDKVDENTDIHVANLDHLGENEALCVEGISFGFSARRAERGEQEGGAASAKTYLFDVSEIGFHDGARIRLSDASEEKKSKKEGDMP